MAPSPTPAARRPVQAPSYRSHSDSTKRSEKNDRFALINRDGELVAMTQIVIEYLVSSVKPTVKVDARQAEVVDSQFTSVSHVFLCLRDDWREKRNEIVARCFYDSFALVRSNINFFSPRRRRIIGSSCFIKPKT